MSKKITKIEIEEIKKNYAAWEVLRGAVVLAPCFIPKEIFSSYLSDSGILSGLGCLKQQKLIKLDIHKGELGFILKDFARKQTLDYFETTTTDSLKVQRKDLVKSVLSKFMAEFSWDKDANLVPHVEHLTDSPIGQEDKVWLLAHLGWYHCQVNKDMSKALDYLQKGLLLNLEASNGVNNVMTAELLAAIATIHIEFYEKSPNIDLFRQQGCDHYKQSLQVYSSLDESNYSLEKNHQFLYTLHNYIHHGSSSFNEEEKKFCKKFVEQLFASSEKLLNGKINKEWAKTLETIKGICFELKLEEEGKAYSNKLKKVEEALKNGQETLEEENNSHTTDNNNSNKDEAEDYSVGTSGEITDFSSK